MKSRCPECQTVFRVTPDQLKARAGKVRCGQCQNIFNALDSLLDEDSQDTQHRETKAISESSENQPESVSEIFGENHASPNPHPLTPLEEVIQPPSSEIGPSEATDVEDTQILSEAAAQELGKASGLILPREMTQIPGYSKWAEGVMSGSSTPPMGKTIRWPFVLIAVLLIITLAGQIAFRFRSEIAVGAPALRPALEILSQVFDSEIPMPHHVELISIENSDLQTDPTQGNLLVLNAILRNRASYGQAYPSLELSLTDTQDAAIARRVFAPGEYLSPKIQVDKPFGENSDVAVRVWIEAKDISAAGYRLYVFYP